MRYLVGFVFVLALGTMGCGETAGTGGSGGDGGYGHGGGNGGTGWAECPHNVCPCTAEGIRAAVYRGGGPYTFDCGGPRTVVAEFPIFLYSYGSKEVILDGEGNLTVEGDGSYTVFDVQSDAVATLRGFTVVKGDDPGIMNSGTLTLERSTVSDNTVDGIYNRRGATLSVIDSTVSGNTHSGILSEDGATVTVERSTVSDNTRYGIISDRNVTLTVVDSRVAVADPDQNNAIHSSYGTSIVLTRSTVSGHATGAELTMVDSAVSGSLGGERLSVRNSTVSGSGEDPSIYVGGGSLTLANSTVLGDIVRTQARAELTNSLVVGVCHCWSGCGDDPIVSLGHNIESPGDTCGFDQATDQVNVSADDLKLGPLQDNGGPTETHALGEGSVAIDVIPEAGCEVDTDQRGEPRPETGGTMCDVGAFEAQP
jgi:hypothetical protein